MKNLWFCLLSVICFCACTPHLSVKVQNPINAEREKESVEVAWSDLTSKVEDITPETVVVFSGEQQIPSQVLYEKGEPIALLFQADVSPLSSSRYSIEKGERENYPVLTFGRQVPERFNDYAWENNLVVSRVFGAPLAYPQTPGVDVWVKNTDSLVIDDWYAQNDYHKNRGEGMDCYRVDATLGGGGCTPYFDGKMIYAPNYTSIEMVDEGPLRTTALLNYGPFKVGERSVTMTRRISIDANTRFTKMENTLYGDFDTLQLAVGIAEHRLTGSMVMDGLISITELASDSANPREDGEISVSVLADGTSVHEDMTHLFLLKSVTPEEPFVQWVGSGWSKGGVESSSAWTRISERHRLLLRYPLRVTVK